MNILNELKSKFNIAEPIFDYEIEQMGYSVSDIEDTIKSGVFEELNGVDFIPCRIFYLVGYSDLFNLYERLNRDSFSIVYKYFVGNDFEYGYLDGFCSLNKLNLSTQVCFSYKIKSYRIDREVKIGRIILSPEKEGIDYKLTMCVKAFKDFRDAFDCTLDSAISYIKLFLTNEQFNKFMMEVSDVFTQ